MAVINSDKNEEIQQMVVDSSHTPDNTLELDFREIQILHLDDHRLFFDGLSLSLKKAIPNVKIFEFGENDSALNFIRDKISAGFRIDLIITDYNHPGPNGLIFAQEVKKMEKYFQVRLPIVMLTMRWNDEFLFNAESEGIIDFYLSKNSSPELIIRAIKEIIKEAEGQ